ncbi:MAG TPA: helix-turn-helix domain-containing protein [Kofleriaceae bacterium]|nr:helix-turn-helix domain-containing protein [Kofleriaceae bacterium]
MRLFSTRELADALGASESSLKRWIDAGKIAASRTEGGHRRVERAEAVRFIRETGARLARPELLDLPEIAVARSRGEQRLGSYLLEGDAVGARGWLLSRYLEGAGVAELADGPIREAMQALGELWHHESTGIFVEHRGTDACLQAIAQLRSIAAAPDDAPVAVGGAPAGDPYLVPSQLAATTIAESGMRSINLGPDTPVDAFAHAVHEHAPALVWTSISTPLAPPRARSIARWLESLPARIAIIVGGRQSSSLAKLPARARRLGSMGELADAVRAMLKRGRGR